MLIVSDTLLHALDKGDEDTTQKLHFGLFAPSFHYDPHNQWILPVSLGTKFEELESRGILDNKCLFRNLLENGIDDVAR